MGSEVQESKEKKVEGSEEKAKGGRKNMLGRKRAGKEQQQESSKKQRMEKDKESNEVEEVSEDDEVELKKHLVIKRDEDIAIDAIPFATKLQVVIDYKLYKEGMLAKYSDIRPEDEFERVLWGDLKVMFEPDKISDVWRILQGYRVTIWKLIDSSGVHFVSTPSGIPLRCDFGGVTSLTFWELNGPFNISLEYLAYILQTPLRGDFVYAEECSLESLDVHYLGSFENEFPAIVYKDALISEQEILTEPTVTYFNDFDYFKDFEKEFPAIAYNDALTSDFSPEPTLSPQHINEFDKTSLSECDDKGQNIIYFNDLFPFIVIYPDDLSDKDNDNDKIDIEHSSRDISIEPLPNDLKGKKSTNIGEVSIIWNSCS
ncbi:hypothetical protein Tco_1060061 [Tanacetum coccineum]